MCIEIKEIYDRNEKLRFMKECDDSFTISVIKRPNFESLFNKIDSHAVFLGAYYTDNIAGYAAFYANNPLTLHAFLTLICVHKQMQRMHIGNQLLQFCVKISRDRGMKTMGLQVLKSDTGAIAFYSKNGFSLEDESKDGFLNMKVLL